MCCHINCFYWINISLSLCWNYLLVCSICSIFKLPFITHLVSFFDFLRPELFVNWLYCWITKNYYYYYYYFYCYYLYNWHHYYYSCYYLYFHYYYNFVYLKLLLNLFLGIFFVFFFSIATTRRKLKRGFYQDVGIILNWVTTWTETFI